MHKTTVFKLCYKVRSCDWKNHKTYSAIWWIHNFGRLWVSQHCRTEIILIIVFFFFLTIRILFPFFFIFRSFFFITITIIFPFFFILCNFIFLINNIISSSTGVLIIFYTKLIKHTKIVCFFVIYLCCFIDYSSNVR